MQVEAGDRHAPERFAVCVTPGAQRTLVALLQLSQAGGVGVMRAAVRSSAMEAFAVDAAAGMWRRVHRFGPVAVVVCHAPEFEAASLVRRLCGRAGRDVVAVEITSPVPGTWAAAVAGGASGLGLRMTTETGVMMVLARECAMLAVGRE